MSNIKLGNSILKVIMIFVVLILFIVVILYAFALTSRDRGVLLQKPSVKMVNGQKRYYLISNSKSKSPKKLLIALHAFGDNPRRFAYYTALHNSVDDQTIVVYPSAIKPSTKGVRPGWNSGFCCGSGWVSKIDDVAYIETLIKEFATKYNIKPQDTFLAGFSNGSFMAQKFAAEKPELIGGVVASSGTIGTTKLSIIPKAAIPILLMHGKEDKTIPFYGGIVGFDKEFDWLPFSKTESVWRAVNKNEAETKVIIYEHGGHTWNGWRILNFWHKKTNASNEASRFLNSINNEQNTTNKI
jgi:poly(3-hydroxybutyrate) depolymerase